MVVAMAAMTVTRPLQGRRQFVKADRPVTIGVELAENIIGLRNIGAAGAERALELGLADLTVAVAVDLREQILQRVRCAHGSAGR